MSLEGKTIILGVSGSIAAYKTASLASALVKQKANVHVIMTKNATNFIHPITFETLTGNKCLVDTFDRNFEFQVEHVSLAEQADLMMIAPASANVIAKLANGLCDDMLTTTALACEAPMVLAPAMNTHMYNKPVTQINLSKCANLGMTVLTPAEGRLACGTTGVGKMPEPEDLLEVILFMIEREKTLAGKKVLVTAGPTREALDPVRFLSNHSTGKMGYAIASQAAKMGAEVTLVSGPVNLKAPLGVEVIDVVSAEDMYEAVTKKFEESDIVVKAAAVADFTPKEVCSDKIKKAGREDASLELTSTKDIIKALGEKKTHQFLCGFSMETKDLEQNSREKLEKKNLDMIVANNLKEQGAGFGTDTNVVTLITREKEEHLPLLSKDDVAYELLSRIQNYLQ
ncbi:MAG: bifunctional phosphopantothenoylcysteine decarboxylase/phosphopantothenate--cysteine ligase CoaBC [Lachnospiraceae bacterium]|nr:bifunctional phosphopantothenoylcysteine decarboxylase/phosphopantothenate--cysteine ligase CoaBC [Lachnospiraceae bacterium]